MVLVLSQTDPLAYSKCMLGPLLGENLLVGSVELKWNGLEPVHRKDVTTV